MRTEQRNSVIKVEDRGLLNNTVIATAKIKAYRVLYQSREYLILPKPSYQTVQIAENAHILDYVFANLNHHCTPNTFIDVNNLKLVAMRDIDEGEQLNFAYFTTEVKLDKPFSCQCGSPDCIGDILGACQTPKSLLKKYPLSQHIQRVIG